MRFATSFVFPAEHIPRSTEHIEFASAFALFGASYSQLNSKCNSARLLFQSSVDRQPLTNCNGRFRPLHADTVASLLFNCYRLENN